jgi:hypothetical protein
LIRTLSETKDYETTEISTDVVKAIKELGGSLTAIIKILEQRTQSTPKTRWAIIRAINRMFGCSCDASENGNPRVQFLQEDGTFVPDRLSQA